MKQITTTITQRGQVTIPVEVMRLLKVKPRDRITFAVDGDEVRLVPAKFTIETAFGSVQPLNHPEDFKELGRIAKEEHARRVVEEMSEGM